MFGSLIVYSNKARLCQKKKKKTKKKEGEKKKEKKNCALRTYWNLYLLSKKRRFAFFIQDFFCGVVCLIHTQRRKSQVFDTDDPQKYTFCEEKNHCACICMFRVGNRSNFLWTKSLLTAPDSPTCGRFELVKSPEVTLCG